ncbi:MAG: hypothetical protein SFY80_02355 [Verrucomicrobiota bacterium]|nr:hypothetical protein [Verrucomicrobiota bacterium]
MMDLFKKTVMAGIGATVVTKELVERKLGEFVEKGKISSQEAREMAAKIAEEGKKEFEQSKQELSTWLDETVKKAALARQKDLDALTARVAALETQAQCCQSQEQATKPPTA